MAVKAIGTGSALIVLGIIVSIASDSNSATSLIPAFVGIVIAALGLVARARPALNRHLMHAAAGIALLAALGSVGSAIGRGSTGWALFAQLATAVICAVFVAFGVASFREARRAD